MTVAKLDRLSSVDLAEWAAFATQYDGGDVYGCPSWAHAVVGAYALDGYILIATSAHLTKGHLREASGVDAEVDDRPSQARASECDGFLPLIWVRHRLFGNSLVSLPFCDGGGGLLGCAQAESELVEKACELADELDVPAVDIRRQRPLEGVDFEVPPSFAYGGVGGRLKWKRGWEFRAGSAEDKVRMLLALPDSSQALMGSFKAKLRSQIHRPIKEGLKVRTGGQELVDDFYRVFVENMRDIGSPVHSRRFVGEVVAQYGKAARVFVVYLKNVPLAASVTLGFRDVLSNPWASSLRRYSQLAPNMLLYWSMLEYACENGYRTFDFGRSSVGEGTYRFKEQWGARPEPLYWYRFTRGDVKSRPLDREGGGMSRAVEIWKRLPLPVTRFLGPRIRRHISL